MSKEADDLKNIENMLETDVDSLANALATAEATEASQAATIAADSAEIAKDLAEIEDLKRQLAEAQANGDTAVEVELTAKLKALDDKVKAAIATTAPPPPPSV